MRATRAALSLLVLLTLLAAPAAGQIVYEDITVHMSAEEFRADFRGDHFSVSDSRWLRALIDDEHGDGDGNVDEDEVEAYVEAQKAEINAQLATIGAGFLFNGIRVGENRDETRASVTRTITDIRYSEEVLGPVDGSGAVVSELDARLTFADTTKPRVTVLFADDFRNPFRTENLNIEWEQAVFRGSGSWEIDGDTTEPARVREDYFQDGVFTVTYDEMGEFSSSQEPLSFAIVDTAHEAEGDDSRGSPVGAPLAFLAVLCLALGARRLRAR